MDNFELIKDNTSLAVTVAGNFLKKLKDSTGIVITRETPERVLPAIKLLNRYNTTIVVDDSLSFASLYCSCKVGPLVLL